MSVLVCGSTCGHNHDSLNGPTGCCSKHGPYMYFCSTCHDLLEGSTVTAPLPDPIDNPADLDVPTSGEPGPPCARCGVALPPLPIEVKRALTAGLSVELSHTEGECPGDDRRPAGRYFEVRVDIVEVVDPTMDSDTERDVPLRVTELVSFKHGLRAASLDEAMRPLALGLGEKWQQAEKQAGIADGAGQ